MKVALGQRIQEGPWGGGNRFVRALAAAHESRGDKIVYSLSDPDIDIILLTDPRARNPSVAFTLGQVASYVARHPNCLVVHRINECDERKGTRSMNFRLRLANYLADHTVFISSWLGNLDVWRRESPHSVILNGADRSVFHADGNISWSEDKPMRLVTHHWGAHALKGFDVYKQVDLLLKEPGWKDRLEMTYVGNLPPGVAFERIRRLPPLDGTQLAGELRRHHAYVTASVNEPAGMHHIEGALCGLPMLFRDSGALPEYCRGYGEMFTGPDDFVSAFERMRVNYRSHQAALHAYDNDAARMCKGYMDLFDGMLADRGSYVRHRQPKRDPIAATLIRLPF